MKYPSLTAVTETLRSFFAKHPTKDALTLEEIYIASGRDLSNPEQNKRWLLNKLTHLKHYQLVTTTYRVRDHYKTLDKVQLTREGKRALGKDGTSSETVTHHVVTLESIARDIRQFEKENPSIALELTVVIKKEI